MRRFSLAHCCCPDSCPYQASDGSRYTDSFGSVDGGWTINTAADTMGVSSGHLQVTIEPSPTHYGNEKRISRGVSNVSRTGLVTIAEVDVYQETNSTFTGLRLIVAAGGQAISATLEADWSGAYRITPFPSGGPWPSSIAQTPVDGDKLSIRVFYTSGDLYSLCAFINEELVLTIDDVTITDTTPDISVVLTYIHLDVAGGLCGSWGNFTWQ